MLSPMLSDQKNFLASRFAEMRGLPKTHDQFVEALLDFDKHLLEIMERMTKLNEELASVRPMPPIVIGSRR
jgi:hypothetical protein